MGLMDRIKGMLGDHGDKATEKAGEMTDTARERMADTGHQAADKMPGPAGDAMGNLADKARPAPESPLEQAESDMESEGGHEWEK
ncbi:hypothetical protein GCM10009665_38450 [Kitasatospora nipponensis]|uniref:Antitoxin protein of toxin-antitoxin system n=1 Tax=Kitasatospora nipponensis TaxID=258049 RepID=A0ABN1WHS9_9ACTN